MLKITYSRRTWQPTPDHREKPGHSRHTSEVPFLVRKDFGRAETTPLQIYRGPAHIRGQIFDNANILNPICHLGLN